MLLSAEHHGWPSVFKKNRRISPEKSQKFSTTNSKCRCESQHFCGFPARATLKLRKLGLPADPRCRCLASLGSADERRAAPSPDQSVAGEFGLVSADHRLFVCRARLRAAPIAGVRRRQHNVVMGAARRVNRRIRGRRRAALCRSCRRWCLCRPDDIGKPSDVDRHRSIRAAAHAAAFDQHRAGRRRRANGPWRRPDRPFLTSSL
jgi:hypothetical protein